MSQLNKNLLTQLKIYDASNEAILNSRIKPSSPIIKPKKKKKKKPLPLISCSKSFLQVNLGRF